MKKVMGIIFLAMFLISFSSAFTANLTIIDEKGAFSGAILKMKSPDTSEFGSDKIYASEYRTDVGIVKFELETSLPEADFNIRLTKDGQIVTNVDKGPYSINGSDILIDLREKKEKAPLEITNTTNETAPEENTTANTEENTTTESEETTEDSETSDTGDTNFFVSTGRAIFTNPDGSINLTYSIPGGAVLIAMLLFVVLMMRGSKSNKQNKSDEKELRKAEAEIKKKEAEIKRIKEGKNRNVRLLAAKEKLAREEKELQELKNSEKKENKEEEEKEEKVEEEIKEAKEDVEEAKQEEEKKKE
jgi:hypothetical protein